MIELSIDHSVAQSLGDNEKHVAQLLDRDWNLLLGGHSTAGESGRTFDVRSPYSETVIARVPDGSARDVEAAVEHAERAASAWGSVPAKERARYIFDLADRIAEAGRDLALLDAIDSGAPVSVMAGDIDLAVESLRFYAGLALEIKGDTIPASENLHFTERQPFGVVGRIIPFNHPALFAISKLAAPLVAGNAVVLKPAEVTPLSALYLGRIVTDVLPAAVVSVVVGDGLEVPQAIVSHAKIRRIGFTGSQSAGRSVQRLAAETAVKDITLELGGKNALIACADADPADVADGAVRGMNFSWSGQSCGSTSRLLVHESIADAVLRHITDQLTVRSYVSPLDPGCEQGTIVSERQHAKVMGYIDTARAMGARVVVGGSRPPVQGLFVEPTVLDGLDRTWPVANEEIFGPVLSVLRWRDEDDAVRLANSVEYGLTGSVYTNDVKRAHRIARALETGYVWINGTATHFYGMPYGGFKNSGLGREESLEELLSYTQLKSVNVFL